MTEVSAFPATSRGGWARSIPQWDQAARPAGCQLPTCARPLPREGSRHLDWHARSHLKHRPDGQTAVWGLSSVNSRLLSLLVDSTWVRSCPPLAAACVSPRGLPLREQLCWPEQRQIKSDGLLEAVSVSPHPVPEPSVLPASSRDGRLTLASPPEQLQLSVRDVGTIPSCGGLSAGPLGRGRRGLILPQGWGRGQEPRHLTPIPCHMRLEVLRCPLLPCTRINRWLCVTRLGFAEARYYLRFCKRTGEGK